MEDISPLKPGVYHCAKALRCVQMSAMLSLSWPSSPMLFHSRPRLKGILRPFIAAYRRLDVEGCNERLDASGDFRDSLSGPSTSDVCFFGLLLRFY